MLIEFSPSVSFSESEFSVDGELDWRVWVVQEMSFDFHLFLKVAMFIFHWLYFLTFLVGRNLER